MSVVFDIDGDYNDDDKVDKLDFDLWKLAYGQAGTPFSLLADGNLDGVVDAADYTVWRNNLGLNLATIGFANASGTAVLGLGQGSAVPEPSALILLTIIVPFVFLKRSPRDHRRASQ